jgi:hypothetical protein
MSWTKGNATGRKRWPTETLARTQLDRPEVRLGGEQSLPATHPDFRSADGLLGNPYMAGSKGRRFGGPIPYSNLPEQPMALSRKEWLWPPNGAGVGVTSGDAGA